jgi:hypothetical protein
MKPPPHTQCATGKYTMVAHRPAKSSQPANLVRSEIAPLIRATVMIANIIWKAMNTYTGTPMPLGFSAVAPHRSPSARKVLVPR